MDNIRDIAPFGRKGAALAAFGDMVVVAFFVAEVPLMGVAEGVKLGDSTFNRFLLPVLPASASYTFNSANWDAQPFCKLCSVYPLRVMIECAALSTSP